MWGTTEKTEKIDCIYCGSRLGWAHSVRVLACMSMPLLVGGVVGWDLSGNGVMATCTCVDKTFLTLCKRKIAC